MAQRLSVGIAGFGNVGRAFAKLLIERAGKLSLGEKLRIVFIADSKGAIASPEGLPVQAVAKALETPRGRLYSIDGYGRKGVSVEELLEAMAPDVLVDVTPSIYEGEPPQLRWHTAVLSAGGAVVPANTAPLALKCSYLLCGAWGRRVYYKATVMAGTPLIDLLRYGLAGRNIKLVRGVLNGTTNYILGLLEKGVSFAEAVGRAQAEGYAEPDPSTDLKGFDLAAKAAIVSCTIGRPVSIHDVRIEDQLEPGIERRVGEARSRGLRLKYVAVVDDKGPRVMLETLTPDDPLARAEGVTNAAYIETSEAPPITIYGPGAGPMATASALLSDLVLAIENLQDKEV